MKWYLAISTEKGQEGRILGDTKSPNKYKGMNKNQFEKELKKDFWQSFRIEERTG